MDLFSHLFEPITSKKRMYDLLVAGRLGNTVPQFFSTWDWQASEEYQRCEYWGVRGANKSGHPGCKMNLKREEILPHLKQFFPDGGYNISVMLERIPGMKITGWFEVVRDHRGLIVSGFLNPLDENPFRVWREAFKKPNQWKDMEGIGILKQYLNDCSYEDLQLLLSRYTGHVIEMSALNQCYGTMAHRNACVWEVRQY